ncbi:hypothetical protein STENM223S_05229 [Streptomyces tendae]
MKFCVGVSSHSTSLSASPTLSRPPETFTAKRSSVSSRRSVLQIQLAVGCWAAAITEMRSWTTSSSVSPAGCISMREVTSGPGTARFSFTSCRSRSPTLPYAATGSSPSPASKEIRRSSTNRRVSSPVDGMPHIWTTVRISRTCT